MEQALADAALPDGLSVGAIYAHGTGTRVGDAAEIAAINSVYEHQPDVLVTSLKGALGHTGGAAAAMNLVAGLMGMARSEVLPTAATVNVDPAARFIVPLNKAREADIAAIQINGFGFGGQDASLVVTRE
jgi:3-oxoacyl-[acyl-carrier-protein] synthase II